MVNLFRRCLLWINEGILFNPVWICVHKLRSKIRSTIEPIIFPPSGKWLDVGCGLQPYESYFPAGSYVGVDIEASGRDPI